jgi:hypothetical protein
MSAMYGHGITFRFFANNGIYYVMERTAEFTSSTSGRTCQ